MEILRGERSGFVIASGSEAIQTRVCTPDPSGSHSLAQMKSAAVYIMASRRNGTFYVGVTAHLPRRAFEHREGITPGFTRRYGCKLLVYYEAYEDMISAITREKQLKAGSRKQKLVLIEAMNPEWRDLYPDFA